METIIVYIDDADYALPLLQAAGQSPNAANTHWLLVACAPRITHRVSRFVSNRAREQWRTKWADKLFQGCVPQLQAYGCQVTPVLARSPLPELVAQLQAEHGSHAQVVDLRRPRQEETAAQAPAAAHNRGPLQHMGATLASLTALWTLCLGDLLAA